jgi:ribonuclease-3
MKSPEIATFEGLLKHSFSRPELLKQALTHSSQAREQEAQQPLDGVRVGDNEQLEFLGDAVLSLVTTETLFERFPQFREGELSKLRAHLVSERHLIQVAKQLDLGTYLHLGRGEEKSGGRAKTALLVDALEAVIAAIYLDGGMEPARAFVLETIVQPELLRIASIGTGLPVTDYKSALQEKLQAAGRAQPSYVLVKEQGPEHSKTFTVEARLRGLNGHSEIEFTGQAEGLTKKNAEQDAARQVLEYLAGAGASEQQRKGRV